MSEADTKLFQSIGLDDKRSKDTVKNADLTAVLKAIIGEANVQGGCDKAIGNLLYSLATSAASTSPIRKDVAKYIGESKIKSPQQYQAAVDYAKKHTTFDQKTFDVECGVGIVVSTKDIENAVDQLFIEKKSDIDTKKWHIPIGDLLTPLKERLKWADMKDVKTILDKKMLAVLGPKVEEQKKPKNQSPPTTSQTAKLEESMERITLTEDKTLPAAKLVKIRECSPKTAGQRVHIQGWIHHVRVQKKTVFLEIRDGSGFLQCIVSSENNLLHPSLVGDFIREATVSLYGKLTVPPEGKTCPQGVELQVDYWKLLFPSNIDIEGVINKDSDVDQLLNQRHIALRGSRMSSIMKLRSHTIKAFRDHFFENGYFEVTPPTLVNTHCEGGSELFTLDYFGEPAFLTQSSQLYLEAMIPVVGDAFCMAQSYRAEQSKTRRHLAEFTHIEVECPFIKYEQLLDRIEFAVCDVAKRVMDIDKELVLSINPNAKVPERPFLRMDYTDGIKYCQENNIYKDEATKTHFEYGDDIPEAQERKMNDQIGKPIFFCRFPAEMKAFYMARCPENKDLTESTDLLMPGVGEIVGGSMRIPDHDQLMAAYEREGLDTSEYYWFTDQRKYGSCEHGGYGLGLERFLTWFLGLNHIRDVVPFPRFVSRCHP